MTETCATFTMNGGEDYEHRPASSGAPTPSWWMPHPDLGEEPGAVVVLKPGAHVTETQLQAFVKERLAAFKVPAKVLFSSEPLPRNDNGKVIRARLRDMLAPTS